MLFTLLYIPKQESLKMHASAYMNYHANDFWPARGFW